MLDFFIIFLMKDQMNKQCKFIFTASLIIFTKGMNNFKHYYIYIYTV